MDTQFYSFQNLSMDGGEVGIGVTHTPPFILNLKKIVTFSKFMDFNVWLKMKEAKDLQINFLCYCKLEKSKVKMSSIF